MDLSIDSNVVAQRLKLEAIAFDMGFCDKLMSVLVADLLQGACHLALDIDRLMSLTPVELHIRKELREAIYQAGKELKKTSNFSYEDVKETLNHFRAEISSVAKENGIIASTGDCRGACKYNTGDRSEYRNYGW